ncbi:MAG: hypothetical protein J0I77_17935 [Rudaea sp.]|uniref:hypothetical protein n=1 Tax=unclassified Rudaea TaxID=2627037 RepID=UPI0014853CDD|nr:MULTISPECIES: hypothetical protein [unclassified Rudaea]MBN8887610.1 hypothetical protein [Rudaea sp.]
MSIRCNTVLLCVSSILSAESGMWTFVNVVESLRVLKLNERMQLETHSYWEFDDEDKGKTTFRLEIWSTDENLVATGTEHTVDVAESGTARIKQTGFVLPPTEGKYVVRMAWRKGDGEWSRSEARWRITVELVTDPAHQTLATI